MNDCIDREELIGSIQYLFDGLADSWVEASEKIIEIIREEPTVPQKEYTEQQIRDTFNSGYACGMESEWTICEDEMPIDSQEVIASVYWTDYGDTILAYGHYNARFDNWKLYSDSEGELIKGYEVVAWMPMPYPYTADRKTEPLICDGNCWMKKQNGEWLCENCQRKPKDEAQKGKMMSDLISRQAAIDALQGRK